MYWYGLRGSDLPEDISSLMYNIKKKMFSGGSQDYHEPGTHYFVIPIKDYDSIYLDCWNPGTKTLDYKLINFDFEKCWNGL